MRFDWALKFEAYIGRQDGDSVKWEVMFAAGDSFETKQKHNKEAESTGTINKYIKAYRTILEKYPCIASAEFVTLTWVPSNQLSEIYNAARLSEAFKLDRSVVEVQIEFT